MLKYDDVDWIYAFQIVLLIWISLHFSTLFTNNISDANPFKKRVKLKIQPKDLSTFSLKTKSEKK